MTAAAAPATKEQYAFGRTGTALTVAFFGGMVLLCVAWMVILAVTGQVDWIALVRKAAGKVYYFAFDRKLFNWSFYAAVVVIVALEIMFPVNPRQPVFSFALR